MKRLGLILFFLICPGILFAQGYGSVYVNGYNRQDGQPVQPHFRSAPNDSPYDNWGSRGNSNPYTGSQGTRDPDNRNSFGSPLGDNGGYLHGGRSPLAR